jgi:predicted membrane chloride channel (bestrophin family)
MNATYAQYLRAETRAGGLSKSTRQLIRAARTMLSPAGKTRNNRESRHDWLRSILAMRQEVLNRMR